VIASTFMADIAQYLLGKLLSECVCLAHECYSKMVLSSYGVGINILSISDVINTSQHRMGRHIVIVFTLFFSDFSNAMSFCGEFSKIPRGKPAC
jgi:hypothetical protein